MMIVVQVVNDQVQVLGEFPSIAEAGEVYGDDIIGFTDNKELEEFKEIVENVRVTNVMFSHFDEFG